MELMLNIVHQLIKTHFNVAKTLDLDVILTSFPKVIIFKEPK